MRGLRPAGSRGGKDFKRTDKEEMMTDLIFDGDDTLNLDIVPNEAKLKFLTCPIDLRALPHILRALLRYRGNSVLIIMRTDND